MRLGPDFLLFFSFHVQKEFARRFTFLSFLLKKFDSCPILPLNLLLQTLKLSPASYYLRLYVCACIVVQYANFISGNKNNLILQELSTSKFPLRHVVLSCCTIILSSADTSCRSTPLSLSLIHI